MEARARSPTAGSTCGGTTCTGSGGRWHALGLPSHRICTGSDQAIYHPSAIGVGCRGLPSLYRGCEGGVFVCLSAWVLQDPNMDMILVNFSYVDVVKIRRALGNSTLHLTTTY